MSFTGNCGCIPNHLSYARYSSSPLRPRLALTIRLDVTVLNSVRVLNVPVVNTNICVINVKGLIHLNLAFFVPVVKPQNPLPRLPNPQSPAHRQNDLPTPVRVDRLSFFLSGYIPSIAELLVSGFTFGFPIHHEGKRISSHSDNLMSALYNPDVVDLKIESELLAGRLSGPFVIPPLSPFRVSPLGVFPKKAPFQFRLIHHLSYPKGSSVKDGISADFSSVRYATITDAIKHIRAVGQGRFLSKTDIKKCLQNYSSSPKGMKWRNLYYFDKCMPMGCSSTCRTFELFSSALEWVAQNKLNIGHIIHLLDDFLINSATSQEICQ